LPLFPPIYHLLKNMEETIFLKNFLFSFFLFYSWTSRKDKAWDSASLDWDQITKETWVSSFKRYNQPESLEGKKRSYFISRVYTLYSSTQQQPHQFLFWSRQWNSATHFLRESTHTNSFEFIPLIFVIYSARWPE
jgi:hypothetical protein